MSNIGSNRTSTSKLQAPASRLTQPSSRLAKPLSTTTSTPRNVSNTTLQKPASLANPIQPRVPISKANSISNNSSNTSIADSDMSSIKSDDTSTLTNSSKNASSTTLGSLSMCRTTSTISSRTQKTNTQRPINNNETYSMQNDTTKRNSGSGDIVKNIEDVIARNKILEEENNVLKNLIHEENESPEGFDERRVLMLKCQVYQLEKQINILSRSLSFRKNAHTDALNTIATLSETFRSTIQNLDGRSSTPVKSISIDRGEFLRWTDMAESSRLKLIKTEDCAMSDENLKEMSEQSLLTTKFSKTNSKNADILDVCSGNLDHINLKQVGVLESNLSKLYKKLCRLKISLQTNSNNENDSETNQTAKSHLLPLHKENLRNQLEDCSNATRESCENLFDLMLIVPNAPWSVTKKTPIDKLTQESLLTKLKSIGIPKSKYQPIEVLFKAFFVASNYHHHIKSNELCALEEEIEFYRSSYSTQKSYIESVMHLFMKKYEHFIEELQVNLSVPLKSLIERFWIMKTESSEENLKEFLSFFKHYAKKFEQTLENIENMPKNDLIGNTFNELLRKLDTEVITLNSNFQKSIESLDLNKINLKELSNESDQIFSEVVSLTPKSSPFNSPTISMNDLKNI